MKRRVLVTLTGGGYLAETLALLRTLGTSYDYCYVTCHGDLLPREGEIPPGPCYRMRSVTQLRQPSPLARLRGLVFGLSYAWHVLRVADPDVIVCVGTSIAVPLCFWGRVLRRRTVFVESIARAENLSTTGRILARLRLVDRFYVQWPDLCGYASGAVYRGTVL